jgi:hypothetical protein
MNTGKDVEKSDRDAIGAILSIFAWRDWGKTENLSLDSEISTVEVRRASFFATCWISTWSVVERLFCL